MVSFNDIRPLLEARKLGARELVKRLSDEGDWGDMGDKVQAKNARTITVADTYYVGASSALSKLKADWTSGFMADWFRKEYGISFKVVGEDIFDDGSIAPRKFRKLGTGLGIVTIDLEIR